MTDVNPETSSSPMVVNEDMKKLLLQTACWTKIVAIISFICCGLMVLAGLFMGIAGASAPQMAHTRQMPTLIVAILYVILGAISLILILYLYRFSTGLPEAFANNDAAAVNKALDYHRRYYKFSVILMAVVIGLSIAFGLVAGIAGALLR